MQNMIPSPLLRTAQPDMQNTIQIPYLRHKIQPDMQNTLYSRHKIQPDMQNMI